MRTTEPGYEFEIHTAKFVKTSPEKLVVFDNTYMFNVLTEQKHPEQENSFLDIYLAGINPEDKYPLRQNPQRTSTP